MPRLYVRFFLKSAIFISLAISTFALLHPRGAAAQNPDQELLKRLQRERGLQPGQRQSPVDAARKETVIPKESTEPAPGEIQAEPILEPSLLEQDYRRRLGQGTKKTKKAIITESGDVVTFEEKEFEGVEQYGYDIFFEPDFLERAGVGRVSADYVLGVGDQIVVTMVGAKSDAFITHIDREGRFVIPDLPPIPAAGLTFESFQNLVQDSASETIVGTDIFLSVGSVRQVEVYVMGEVEQPGLYNLTAMSSVFDALNAAGGIKKSGSLRNIRLIQGKESTKIDLYQFIQGESRGDLGISDGSRISVPTIGPNFAVAGSVVRPGIYEFPAGRNESSLAELIRTAGGPIRPRGNQITVDRIDESGRMVTAAVADLSEPAWDGDIIEVNPKSNYQAGRVTFSGEVNVSGLRPLSEAATVGSFIRSQADLGTSPYLPFAILATTNAESFTRILRPINLGLAIQGQLDVELKDNDSIFVFSEENIRYLSSPQVRNVVLGGDPLIKGCQALIYLADKIQQVEGERFAALKRVYIDTATTIEEDITDGEETTTEGIQTPRTPIELDPILQGLTERQCPEIYRSNPEYLILALENGLGIIGGVRSPGLYPVAGRASLQSLLASAGGPLPNANLENIEIIQPRTGRATGLVTQSRIQINLETSDAKEHPVTPRSTIRVHTLPADQEPGSVLLTGEFLSPGLYSIRKGETLAEVIERAGGLTDQSYPYGAVMTRLTVKAEQQEGFRRTAREINAALASAAVKKDLSAEAAIAVRELATELATVEAPGRMVVEADPAALRARPELNILLEPGDRIHMPKRPQFVVITGDVLNPGALQFQAGKDVKDFLNEAGGLTKTADEDRVFLIYPNGVAKPIKTAPWSFKSYAVPPGSTIVVPKDLRPFTTLDVVRDVTGIFSQLALAAASLAVVADRR